MIAAARLLLDPRLEYLPTSHRRFVEALASHAPVSRNGLHCCS
jgi:hypothetical protein